MLFWYTSNMKLIVMLVGIALLGAIAFFLRSALMPVRVTSKEPTVRIAGQIIRLEIANTVATRARGLSGRASLTEGWGMLFLFSQPSVQMFWMRDMQFPIDIIWIRDNEVVGFAEGALPPKTGESPATFTSPLPVDKVLEVNAGFVEKYGVKIGDRVELEL